MKHTFKNPGFTLVEVLIAITVFSIFIGFSVSAYLTFHRSDQEALVQRSLMMEAGRLMDTLSQDLKQSKIDYDYYAGNGGLDLEGDHVLQENVLALRSADGVTRTLYVWDETLRTFTVQKFDVSDSENPLVLEDYAVPLSLLSEQVFLNEVDFRIFPDVDPYDIDYSSTDAVQFQPVVTWDMVFATEGRVREEVTLPLHSTVTSRYYQ